MPKRSSKKMVLVGRGDVVVGKGFFGNLARGISKAVRTVAGPALNVARRTGALSTVAGLTGNPMASVGLRAMGYGKRRRRA